MSGQPTKAQPRRAARKLRSIVRLGPAVHVARHLRSVYGHPCEWEDERRDVRVMAVAEGYAMVRRPGAVPYVCHVQEIEQPNKELSRRGSHNSLPDNGSLPSG